MNLHFTIDYLTRWGEEVRVVLTWVNRRERSEVQTFPLETCNGRTWTGEISVSDVHTRVFSYHYCIYEADRKKRTEWTVVPRYFRADATQTYCFQDAWRDIPLASHLYTSAFTQCVHPFHSRKEELPYFESTLMLRVDAPQLKDGQALALLGNQPALGDWNPNFAFRMKEVGMYEWSITLNAEGISFPIAYKYVIIDEKTGDFIAWEEGDNRVLPIDKVSKKEVYVMSDAPLRIEEEHWKGAGVVIPVFSLRSEGSCGVGDFGDLKAMVDWAARTTMRVIQILPIYDTTIHKTWRDSYPYNSISIYAFHPQYIDLRQLPALEDTGEMARYEARRKVLNELPQVDYEAVSLLKQEYLRAVYAQEKRSVLNSDAFRDFFSRNEQWLVPYAAFCVLRDCYGTSDFRTWPDHAEYSKREILAFCSPSASGYDEVAFYYYVQFRLHQQLLAACDYARAKGVILKGDIPIGISRNSVEAWVEPYYFNQDGQAGAPPDDFSVNGQNWGFPTYNWEVMFEDGCSWWVRRFRKMAEYFNAYRIDHVLGFFRIWEIPSDSVHGLLGHFSPALPMTAEEIEGYGLHFRKEYFTHPCINDRILKPIFGRRAGEVKNVFLHALGGGQYEMKPEFSTQRRVETALAGRNTAEDVALREGLFRLISNVLFIPDPKDPDKYHPRIAAQGDYFYSMLSDADKRAFNALYDDYYYRRHNAFWYEQAMRKLPVLVEATRMLVCAEDLGMVPECVPWVMENLRILTLEIQTMPKKYGVRFGRLEENPYRSVATIFTHDMPTLRGWWEEDAERTQPYFNEMLQKDGKAPAVIPGWLCEEVVARHLYSPSMLCLISWQDWMSMDETLRYPDASFERINVPADPHNYWHYRMHLTLEQLMACNGLNDKIRS
ncbi:MAG: 4-alpha-glucanotransferase, partial [Paraprevotella sp.]|nr:4-alpha-glucanotransferase [Paraprevotella sp.]